MTSVVGDRLARATRDRVPLYVYVVVAALVCQIFAGNRAEIGVPVAPDRVLLILAGGLFLAHDDRRRWRLELRGLHLLMLALLAWCLASAYSSGTLSESAASSSILDVVGLVPFALLLIAPVAFSSPERRAVLLFGLIAVGTYLGATAIFEVTPLSFLVFPRYITDPAVGVHFGRARGPFVESAADGLVMTFCLIAALLGWHTLRRPSLRLLSAVCGGVCIAGVLFTYTRSVWVAATGAVLSAAATSGAFRRILLPGILVAAASLVLVIGASQSLQSTIGDRVHDERSGFDRLNADNAAVNAVRQHPLAGVGWNAFPGVEDEYIRQNDKYGITATGIPVHNVPLGYAAELGLVGLSLWLAVVATTSSAVLVRLRSPRAPREKMWAAGLLAVTMAWLAVATLVPITYPFVSSLLWLWAGLCASPERLGLVAIAAPKLDADGNQGMACDETQAWSCP